MAKLPIIIVEADTPDGVAHYVTCLNHEHVFEHGLAREAIIGQLRQPPIGHVAISPDNFLRNSVFVEFMHGIVARYAPLEPDSIAEAKRQGNGYLYIIDQRTPNPRGRVPPEDIVGGFELRDGQIVPGKYVPNPNLRILSGNGFIQLDDFLQAKLINELLALRS